MSDHPADSFRLSAKGVRLTVAPLDVLPGTPPRWIASDADGRGAVGSSANAAVSALLDLRDRAYVAEAARKAVIWLRRALDNRVSWTHVVRGVALSLDKLGDPRVMRVLGALDEHEDDVIEIGGAARQAIGVLEQVIREAEEPSEEGAALAA